jgi:uncharacterized protein (DUF1786 family)
MGVAVRVLALDIGVGTCDVLLYDSGRRLENCTRMVLPSPTRLLAARVEEAAARGDIFVTGHTVGGGPFSRAVRRALAAGRKVYMTPAAALSIRNNLEDVASLGIETVPSPPHGFTGTTVTADELDLKPLAEFLTRHGEDIQDLDGVAVAVQDHGTYRVGESNRKTRLAHMRARLEADPFPTALAFTSTEVTEAFPRLASASRRLREQFPDCRVLVMDTSPAAVAGCLEDPVVAGYAEGNLLLVNAGNGHTLACILSGGKVLGLLEHHTRRLDPGAFAGYLHLFCDGEARDEDPFMAEGHGLFYLAESPGWGALDLIAVTGPNRGMLEGTGLDPYYPAPGGDMMMTGPMGLVSAYRQRSGGRAGRP